MRGPFKLRMRLYIVEPLIAPITHPSLNREDPRLSFSRFHWIAVCLKLHNILQLISNSVTSVRVLCHLHFLHFIQTRSVFFTKPCPFSADLGHRLALMFLLRRMNTVRMLRYCHQQYQYLPRIQCGRAPRKKAPRIKYRTVSHVMALVCCHRKVGYLRQPLQSMAKVILHILHLRQPVFASFSMRKGYMKSMKRMLQ